MTSAAYQRAWREAHREELRAYFQRYYRTHRARLRAQRAANYRANRAHRIAQARAAYRASRDEKIAYAAAYQRQHPDRHRAANHRYRRRHRTVLRVRRRDPKRHAAKRAYDAIRSVRKAYGDVGPELLEMLLLVNRFRSRRRTRVR